MSLNAEALHSALRRMAPEPIDLIIDLVQETGSTNADLMQRMRQASSTCPVLLVAERQTAGRGRAGRQWWSEPGGALTFSLAWHFPLPASALLGLPLAVGVAIAECLQTIGVPVQLKWPNDVLKEGKKLAGILLESQPSSLLAGGATWAIIGIGLNLRIPDALEAQIGHTVADAPWLAQMDRNELMAALLQRLTQVLWTFEQAGFAALSDRWNRLHAYQQQSVNLTEAGEVKHQGLALGVDEVGRLRLQVGDDVICVHAGDVSLRPMA